MDMLDAMKSEQIYELKQWMDYNLLLSFLRNKCLLIL